MDFSDPSMKFKPLNNVVKRKHPPTFGALSMHQFMSLHSAKGKIDAQAFYAYGGAMMMDSKTKVSYIWDKEKQDFITMGLPIAPMSASAIFDNMLCD